MPQAPPLGLAKSLFQGVKSSLPAIHDSVGQAKSAVNSAGDNATQLLNLAIGQVEGLNPILDEALSEVLDIWPTADRQTLRNFARKAQSEKKRGTPPVHARKLFRYLRSLSDVAES